MGDTKLQSNSVLAGSILSISEFFYSLQGEGARAGQPSIFIRLQGCSAKHACARSGIICDTEFESGKPMAVDRVLAYAKSIAPRCKWIVWTGGEPLDQLTPEIVDYVDKQGFRQAIETSGIRPFDENFRALFDFVTVSPKVAEHILQKHFPGTAQINELRYVRHKGQPGVPEPALEADHYYLSPHSDGSTINQENLSHCIQLCLENPKWSLSTQQHKIWKVL